MGNLKTVLGLGLGLFGIACREDGGGSRSEFIDYWSDGDARCEHQASCGGGLQSKKTCELAWFTREATEDALELADLSSDQLSKCRASSVAYDDCYLASSCLDLREGADTYCPAERQRLDLDCASLIDAFDLVPVGGFPDPIDDGSSSGTPNEEIASMVCNLSVECAGVSPSPAEIAECVDRLEVAFAFVPDPDGVLDCIRTMSCAQLEADGTTACLDIDPNSTMCVDANTLSLCNTSGECVLGNCGASCASQGFVSAGCAFSADDGFDQCLCTP